MKKISLEIGNEKEEIKFKLTDSFLKELERLRISIGVDDYEGIFKKALLLLNVVNKEKHKGFDRLIMENSHTGEQIELVKFWKEKI